MKLNSYEAWLQNKGHSKATVGAYNRYLMDFLSWLDGEGIQPETVTAGDMMSWLNRLKQKGQGNIARRNSLIAVRHFFDWQLQRELREDNPAKHIKIRGTQGRKLYTILSREELEAIYHHYSTVQDNDPNANRNWFTRYKLSRQRNKVMLGLMVYQGLVTTEVSGLEVKDIHLKEGTVYIAGGRKSNERTLELKPQQVMELMEYLLQTRKELLSYTETKESNKLFIPSPVIGHRRATGDGAIHVWKWLTDEIKQQHPRVTNFLQVRTSVITHWLKQYNLRQVQYMAGHRYVSSTEAYLINQTEDLQNDIDKYHPIG